MMAVCDGHSRVQLCLFHCCSICYTDLVQNWAVFDHLRIYIFLNGQKSLHQDIEEQHRKIYAVIWYQKLLTDVKKKARLIVIKAPLKWVWWLEVFACRNMRPSLWKLVQCLCSIHNEQSTPATGNDPETQMLMGGRRQMFGQPSLTTFFALCDQLLLFICFQMFGFLSLVQSHKIWRLGVSVHAVNLISSLSVHTTLGRDS